MAEMFSAHGSLFLLSDTLLILTGIYEKGLEFDVHHVDLLL